MRRRDRQTGQQQQQHQCVAGGARQQIKRPDRVDQMDMG